MACCGATSGSGRTMSAFRLSLPRIAFGPCSFLNLSRMNSVPFSLPLMTSNQARESSTTINAIKAPTDIPSSINPPAFPIRGSPSQPPATSSRAPPIHPPARPPRAPLQIWVRPGGPAEEAGSQSMARVSRQQPLGDADHQPDAQADERTDDEIAQVDQTRER